MNAKERCTAAVAVVGVGTLIAACGLVIDPDVLVARVEDDAGNTGLSEAGGSEGGTPVPGCKPTGGEVCDDGIDNDCNGRIDCADPACTAGFECQDPPPAGWTRVLLAERARPTCPPRHTPADVRVLEGDGSMTCMCTCGGSCDATLTLTASTDLGCTVAPTTVTFEANTTSCKSKNFDLPSGFTQATAGSGTCDAVDTPTKSDPTDGRTCTPSERVGGGCLGTQRCVPKPAGFATCIAKAGLDACPATAFTKQRRSGTTVNDQRACTGCSCSSTPCDVELRLWTHPVCQGSAGLEITTACTANGAIDNVKAYTSKVTGGCMQATPSVPQGAIVFENEQTICCK